MNLINILFIGVLPAGLLMWAGNWVRTQASDEKPGKYWLWFLMGGLGLSIVGSIIANSISERVFNFSMPVLLPIMFGFTAALGLHIAQNQNIRIGWAILISILIAIFLSWVTFGNNWMMLLFLILVAALTALAWQVWEQNGRQYLLFFAVEVVLLAISVRVTDMNRISDMTPRWLASGASTITYLFIPWAGIVLSALLIRRLFTSKNPLTWHMVTTTFIMVSILFLMIGYQAMLTSLWDVATDGLGWVFLWLTSSTIGIGSAMLMSWSMPRKRLWVSILFALAVPVVLIQARNMANYESDHTWGTKPIITTEHRAEKIDKAIQRYYERNGEYPQTLSDLTPWYLLYIPNPYIIPGLDWCYEGGPDHYRFGYVYRQYFSTPASVKIQSSAGEPSDADWNCQNDADMHALPLGF